MSTVTLNSLEHRRQCERTRAEGYRLLNLRARCDDAERALGRYITARHHEAFDHEMLRDFLVSLLAWCDVAGIPNFEDVLAEAEAEFTALVDPE
jgi:hypothetical protein